MDDPLADLRDRSSIFERMRKTAGADWFIPVVVAVVATSIVAFAAAYLLLPAAAPLPETYLPSVDDLDLGSATRSAAEAGPSSIFVHVAGAVATPGVIELPAGSRVGDALGRAGGAAADAEPDRLNLAAELSDGERVYVPTVGEEVLPETLSSHPDTQSTVVDLNRADVGQLETLPGIGPVTAAAIVAYRDEHGDFGSVADLELVAGIGPKTLDAVLDFIVVS